MMSRPVQIQWRKQYLIPNRDTLVASASNFPPSQFPVSTYSNFTDNRTDALRPPRNAESAFPIFFRPVTQFIGKHDAIEGSAIPCI